jgi:indolepyruvate ferredoxin oxidoreductase alpha subunit
MGAEGEQHSVAVIGDSTFMHSGMTGLANIAYNQSNSTVLILDNSITGMTGHQQNPAMGKTIRGEDTRAVDLIALCKAVGVQRVRVADPFDLKTFEAVVREEVAADEPSVIIAQRPCALLKHVKYAGTCEINDKCKKCKMCMKLGCPAISVCADGSVKIDPTQCNGCGLCLGVCPFGAIEKKED